MFVVVIYSIELTGDPIPHLLAQLVAHFVESLLIEDSPDLAVVYLEVAALLHIEKADIYRVVHNRAHGVAQSLDGGLGVVQCLEQRAGTLAHRPSFAQHDAPLASYLIDSVLRYAELRAVDVADALHQRLVKEISLYLVHGMRISLHNMQIYYHGATIST